jgi:hypothetical protein
MLDCAPRRFFLKSLAQVLAWALSFSVTALAGQQPGQPPPDPNEPNKPSPHHAMSTKDVQDKLQKGLDSKNAAYAGSSIQPTVDDQSVTLNGTVTSQLQHEMALQLVRAYAEDRKIIDKLVIQQ